MAHLLRRLRFWIGLVLGLSAGLLYGWVLHPAQAADSGPGSLRQDYRTDYVLMVAEAYSGEDDLPHALQRLNALGSESPSAYVDSAIAYASDQGFDAADLELLSRLARALAAASASGSAPSP